MEFAYTPRLAELKDRARALAEKIIPFEDECERNNGLCRRVARRRSRRRCSTRACRRSTRPTEFGGAGLSASSSRWSSRTSWASSPTRCGIPCGARPTRWRMRRPEQRERYLIPGARGDRRDAVAISEADAGSDFSAADDHRDTRRQRRLCRQRREVVRHRGRRRRLSASCSRTCSPRHAPTIFLVDVDTLRVKITGRSPLHAHPRLQASRTQIRVSTCASDQRLILLAGSALGWDFTVTGPAEERLMMRARTISAAEPRLTLTKDSARSASRVAGR